MCAATLTVGKPEIAGFLIWICHRNSRYKLKFRNEQEIIR
jgi:hypothetical protein